MADLDFDYAAARRDGYSDLDILKGLQSAGKLNFDLDSALKDNHDPTEILSTIYKRPAPEPAPEPSSLLRRAGDVGISALKGAISVPETVVGLADLVSGGAAGRGAEALGFRPQEAKATLNELYSPEQQAANRKVAEAKGFVDTAGALIQNPSTLVQTGVESLPLMGAGGVVGRGALALAPRIGAAFGGAIGEGVVQAGQAAEQYRQANPNRDLSLGQTGAAIGSGIGTGIFGAVGGRIAQKLGIADIDTALVQAGTGTTTKGVARRLLEGGISEGVFEELPQSIQEQIWQNAAMDKPLLDGVPENAAQGLLAGGLFGGVAGAALHGGTHAPQTEINPQTDEVRQLEYRPDPFISFPDGSVGRQSDVDAFIASQPEDQRIATRARLYGYESQPVTEQDILNSASLDEAIQASNRAIDEGTPEFRAQRGAEIDAAWNQFLGDRAAVRMREFEAAQQQRREQDIPAIQEQIQNQAVEQANALTQAQGFDTREPTAIELAFQRAQARANPQEITDAGSGIRNVSVAGNEGIAPTQPGTETGLPLAGESAVGGQTTTAIAERPAAVGVVNAATPTAPTALTQGVAQETTNENQQAGIGGTGLSDTAIGGAEGIARAAGTTLQQQESSAPITPSAVETPAPAEQTAATQPAVIEGSAANEDDGSDIPVSAMRRIKVPLEVWVEDEGQYENVEMSAGKALESVREDITNLRALLKCLRG